MLLTDHGDTVSCLTNRSCFDALWNLTVELGKALDHPALDNWQLKKSALRKKSPPYRECIYQTLMSVWVTAFWARAMIPFIGVTCVAVHFSMGFTSDRSNSYSNETSSQSDA